MKRAREGYLLISNPMGITYESATITCSHCGCVVVLNPDRSRSRGYCPKCDAYICDRCNLVRSLNGNECVPFIKILEDTQEQAALIDQRMR